jgi:hypothetical protein
VSLANQDIFVEPSIAFDVYEGREQTLFISVTGSDVLEFEGNVEKEPDSRTRALPDPVQVFITVAQHGMFAHPMTLPWLSTAELIDKKVYLAGRKQSWHVSLRNIDHGALLVLANMLLARQLDSIEIRSAVPEKKDPSGTHFTDITQLVSPVLRTDTSFRVDYEVPDRASRERVIELTFAREAEEFAERVYAALESWAMLLMLGGYPGPKQRPYQSAALAEPAFLLEPETIQLEFPDLFLSAEDSFAAIVNYAQMADHAICPVKLLSIR